MGDKGGRYDLSLRAVTCQLDGVGPDTTLVEALTEALDTTEWSRLIPAIYDGLIDSERIAALGPLATAADERGDAVASATVERAGGALGDQAAAMTRRLGLVAVVCLCCMGGVLLSRGAC